MAATLDFTPAGVLAGGGNPVAGLEAATATLRALYKPGSPRAEAAGFSVASAFDDALRTAIERAAPLSVARGVERDPSRGANWWGRWLAGVRDASMAVCDAYWCISPEALAAAGNGTVRLRLAGSLVEAIKWSACDRFSPDEVLWQRLSGLLVETVSADAGLIVGDVPGVAREFLRAVAYHSVGLDQLELDRALAMVHLVDTCVPFLSLGSAVSGAPQYVIDLGAGGAPQRRYSTGAVSQLCFAPWGADELLIGFERQLAEGNVPLVFGKLPRELMLETVRRLRNQWSRTPPVRLRKRYAQDATVEITRGLMELRQVLAGEVRQLARVWRVCDLSRSGLQIRAASDPSGAWPDVGELLGVRFTDGEGWQLAVVRRLQMWPDHARLGLELVSRHPVLVVLDDGRLSIEALLCDQPARGEAVRLLLGPEEAVGTETVFMKHGGGVLKLRLLGEQPSPFGDARGYRLQVFQVG
ncbi:hypothetical protein ACFQ4M_17360 [Thauera mechernichensis]|uniref:PilZ domain-containing protein n=1 Tax=Thauera mechernichensis TaxID=82788 RepID=A0ABW3WK35_9RHOO|nr:hypothetical protein [Thauera mechernichensis]MDG3066440.1 hypothetical protein [Thauera mechernichensis]